jgi:TerC family integral membrane protein
MVGMDVSPLAWLLTGAVILGLFTLDFLVVARVPRLPTLRESANWSALFIAAALVFGAVVAWRWGATHGAEYFAGYVTEESLSVDNLFVFSIIMSAFAVPRENQQKVLLIGIGMALGIRGVFIALGAAAISAFSWVFYLFGLFLVYAAVQLIRERGRERDIEEKRETRIAGLVRRFLPTTDKFVDGKLFTKIDGKRVVTPMLLALLAIGFTDILFALDSIPAIYGLTDQAYIVFTANAFALMGLRHLYFLIGGLLDRLRYLSIGLSVILAFIGVKLMLHALRENTLPFINGGHHVNVPEIPTWISLIVIAVVLAVTTVASLLRTRHLERQQASSGSGEP